MPDYILAIDQGTTSSRAMLFDSELNVRGVGQLEFAQHFPADGWVEHDAEEIWSTTLAATRTAMARASATAAEVAAIGITNQRETTIIWDRRTGKPIHRAIVWQDRRTAADCRTLKEGGYELGVTAATGLRIDPYFSATKIAWILDEVPGARAAAEAGQLAFGTVDSWLIWRLTGGRVHATDATNAARTLLFDIHNGSWDENLLRLFRVPRAMLPHVRDCSADYGLSEAALLDGPVRVLGVAGDQQAAALGQACFTSGMSKVTYGTGCFALVNTGANAVASKSGLLTTIAYQLDGQRTYALEGSIFIAGAAVQWLRDALKIIPDAASTESFAARADLSQDVILVPAFVGLGAPHWCPEARGAIFGLTRATGPNELAKAALQSVVNQTCDLVAAIGRDWPHAPLAVLRVDGGMVASNWLLQDLADMTGAQVDRPAVLETTALGAAWLAGHRAGVLPGMEGFSKLWRANRSFSPNLSQHDREQRMSRWQKAVNNTIAMARDA